MVFTILSIMNAPERTFFLTARLLAGCLLLNGCADPVLSVVNLEQLSYAGPQMVEHLELGWSDTARGGLPVLTNLWVPEEATELRGLVVISHGQGSKGQLHAFIGEHLASHGYVVAANDHFGATLGSADSATHYVTRIGDLKFVIDMVSDDATFGPAADAGIAAIGHSIGGYSALAMCDSQPDETAVEQECANDEGGAWCGLLDAQDRWSGFADDRVGTCIGLTPFVDPIFGYAGESAAALNRPVLLVGADEDRILKLDPSLRRFFDNAPQPGSLLLTIRGAAHLSFTDLLHEGTLDHDILKETTNAYVLAWLEYILHRDQSAGDLLTPQAVASDIYAAHVSISGIRPPLVD